MQENELYNLLQQHLEGTINQQESQLLKDLVDNTETTILQDILSQIYLNNPSKINELDVSFHGVRYVDIKNRIDKDESKLRENHFLGNTTLKYIRYAMAIAAVSVVFFFIIKTYINPSDKIVPNQVVDINPARSIVNIDLGNGQVLKIDSTVTGLVYSENGISVFRTQDGIIEYKVDSTHNIREEYITITTPRGGFSRLTLSDGTKVSLNSASILKYPILFNGKSREVIAEGEIFFDVAKDKAKPFRIHSEKQTIEVLGTSFNLYSNHNEAKTTLIEGAVKIIVDNNSYFLKPGQQSVVASTVKIIDAQVEDALAWTNDQFLFDNGSFFELLKEIENWYDVKFVFQRDDIKNLELSGSLSRKVKLSELLKVLSINTGYTYEIQERRVLVK